MQKTKLFTRVIFKYGNTSSIRAHYKFKVAIKNLPDLNTSFNLTIHFGCKVKERNLTIKTHATDVKVSIPTITKIGLNAIAPGLAAILINDLEKYMSSKVAASIDTEIATINTDFNQASINLPFCPHISTLQNTDVVMNFSSGTQCTNGAERIDPCPAGYRGNGIKFICDNGWWWRLYYGCVRNPQAPPGGHIP